METTLLMNNEDTSTASLDYIKYTSIPKKSQDIQGHIVSNKKPLMSDVQISLKVIEDDDGETSLDDESDIESQSEETHCKTNSAITIS